VRGLTVCQPYAELIARGDKPIENRKWSTNYRGPVLIHAGLSKEWWTDAEEYGIGLKEVAFGAIIAVADLSDCVRLKAWPEKWKGLEENHHANGPWCWIFRGQLRRLSEPIPYKGALGLWPVSPALEQMVRLRMQGLL
jgi:hypothetical protein